ncbi:MAG TPA: CaiB/BaiF CoA-transferase family protein [Ramlibacter sp.]|nr:CaiB/BaiF CoA-transferase family protein [Ramlibacter sp.]
MSTAQARRQGPLAGIKVLEFPAIGPVPFCGMMLSDYGADVVRIGRRGSALSPNNVTDRGKSFIVADLKDAQDAQQILRLAERADVVIEGFRPGVMEKLGFGPQQLMARNTRLIYGRMSGWGQSGPLARSAGHDINYIALAGALAAFGPAGKNPVPPLNLVGDYGGGAMFLALGISTALFERTHSGQGQVIDAAMVDGSALMMAHFTSWIAGGRSVARGDNLIDGSAHFYRTYQCSDGKYIAIGALEPQFHARLWQLLGFPAEEVPGQDQVNWGAASEKLAAVFRTRTREQWRALLEGTDACFAPVLDLQEAPEHPHLRERGVFVRESGVTQPAPAPRFSRTPAAIQSPPPQAALSLDDALSAWASG